MLEITILIQGFWPGGTDKTWRTAGLTGSANLVFFDGILYHPGFLPRLMLILSISFQTV